MDFFEKIVGKFEPKEPTDSLELIYVFLPEALDPLDPWDQYAHPIDAELQLNGLGFVSGGGSLMSEEDDDEGIPIVEFSGIDVDTDDVPAARELLRLHLPELGCPAGTELHYSEAGVPLQDEYDGYEWQLRRPRSLMHPGFGC